MRTYRLDATERAALDRDGFVVRHAVFSQAELAAMEVACEALIARLLEEKRHKKEIAGAYVFETQSRLETAIKWEQDHRDVVQGVEPFVHLSPALNESAHDPRFVDPMRDVLATDDIGLFTEKLNVKRAEHGGPIVLHQDYPYWIGVTQEPARVGTALLFLDDATLENGCLEVVPGSHREGFPKRRKVEGFGQFEIDPDQYDLNRLVALPVPAGSVIYFGSLLVHRSAPNRTDKDRRALLYSYQPAGRKTMVEMLYRNGKNRGA